MFLDIETPNGLFDSIRNLIRAFASGEGEDNIASFFGGPVPTFAWQRLTEKKLASANGGRLSVSPRRVTEKAKTRSAPFGLRMASHRCWDATDQPERRISLLVAFIDTTATQWD